MSEVKDRLALFTLETAVDVGQKCFWMLQITLLVKHVTLFFKLIAFWNRAVYRQQSHDTIRFKFHLSQMGYKSCLL